METATQARAGAPATGEPAISLRNLRRDYDERPVLRGVSLELDPGAALAVIGANGAGKSTLLRILATLLRPSAGEVEVLGASLPREAWKIRGRVGYLGHEPLLYRELSVRENLELNARLHRVEDPSARISNLLERAGLAGRAGELVRNLSAGMLQRAAICRALVHAPDLLLLDEPRSHLDLGAAGVVDELLGPAVGRTRVVVTHEIDSGLGEVDAVLALRADGSVAYAGAARELPLADARKIVEGRDVSAYRAILAKDLRVELRTLESVPAMLLFSATTFVLFRFGLDRESLSGSLAAGVLLATVLFAAILAINRVFVAEREQGGFDLIRLAPVDGTSLYLAKASALFIYLAAFEFFAVPVFAILFLDDAGGLLPLAGVLALTDLGLAAIGALIASLAVNSRARDLIGPLLLLPLLVPVMIGAGGAAEPLLAAGGPSYADFGKWMAVLALYDVVFCLVGYAVYDFVLED